MPDETTLILVGTALFGCGAVVQHFWDRYAPSGLYNRTASQAAAIREELHDLPPKIGSEVENALNRVAEAQERKYEEAAKAAETGLHMSGVRQVGLEKQQMAELKGLMVEGIGGPVFKAIEAWNPEWADKLRAVDPGLLLQFIESPWFVANIKPRIQPYMDKFLGSKTAGASDVNPFLKELGQ